jgi:hypothetical protein
MTWQYSRVDLAQDWALSSTSTPSFQRERLQNVSAVSKDATLTARTRRASPSLLSFSESSPLVTPLTTTVSWLIHTPMKTADEVLSIVHLSTFVLSLRIGLSDEPRRAPQEPCALEDGRGAREIYVVGIDSTRCNNFIFPSPHSSHELDLLLLFDADILQHAPYASMNT